MLTGTPYCCIKSKLARLHTSSRGPRQLIYHNIWGSKKLMQQCRITKAGNIYLRSLLVECANHVLGPHGRDSTLRQWSLHLASRGGKQSRNRAIVAVARKLAVLLHRIWVTQEPYIPFYAVAA